jgi:5-methyltetrahydrofolate--homocysteine methyltransferase
VTMSRLRESFQSGRALLMDGAMGTELQRASLQPGECGELWNLTEPERVRAIHQAYVDAGAQCLLTNTFQANPTALAKRGRSEQLEAINRSGLELARLVAGPNRFVLADIGPIEQNWRRQQMMQVVQSLRTADAILLETYSDLHALWAIKYACLPSLEAEDVPVLLSVTYRRTDAGVLTTHGGQPPEVYGRLARQYGVAALGVNCGRDIGMGEIIEIIRRYRQATDLPLFARPNAGTPVRGENGWVHPQTPSEMAARLPELLEAGVTMIGGCCGTTPAHIAAFRPVVDEWNARQCREGI